MTLHYHRTAWKAPKALCISPEIYGFRSVGDIQLLFYKINSSPFLFAFKVACYSTYLDCLAIVIDILCKIVTIGVGLVHLFH